jgi:hypothetical protein
VPHKREPLQYVVVLREVLKILMSLSLEGKQCVPFGRPDIVSDVPDWDPLDQGSEGPIRVRMAPKDPASFAQREHAKGVQKFERV